MAKLNLQEWLRAQGFYRWSDEIPAAARQGAAFIKAQLAEWNAGRLAPPQRGGYRSFLYRQTQAGEAQGALLLFDIGGSNCRSAYCRLTPGQAPYFIPLVDLLNEQLDFGAQPPLERLALNLFQASDQALREQGIAPATLTGLGIIWSNCFESRRITDAALRGVNGIVSGVAAGIYRKHEFFTQGLKDGTDLGAVFLQAAGDIGFRPQVLVIGNDAVLSALAKPGAHGGMVASTGSNATLLLASGELVNAEMNSILPLEPGLIEADQQWIDPQQPRRVGLLSSGRYLPLRFMALLQAAAADLSADLGQKVALLQARQRTCSLSGADLSELAAGRVPPAFNGLAFSTEELSLLRELTAELTWQGGATAALIGYCAVAALLETETELSLAVDSSQARYFESYRQGLLATMPRLSADGGRIHLIFQRPWHSAACPAKAVSVPMQGLARALAAQ